jgi:uncharacterized protein (TIGR02145 family)
MENSQITNYLIKNSIGQGGMATVYLAEDNKFQTNVAIKVLNKEYVHNDNIRKRFLAEARNMFKMSHPNIIKVTDLIDEGETVAFVMEYIEGETLKEYLDRKGKLSDTEIKNLFSQMLDAVGYVHKQKLVHRDIKPSNFMINREGQIKLMDFGIAKTTDITSAEYTQTGTGVQMGTPMYMSPEQITETKSVTDQSDIYSLGVVLWQMVTGQKPYNTNTLSSFQLQTKIVNEPLDNTNSHWDELIQKATTKDITLRFKSANAFKITLESKNDKKVIESDSTIIDTEIKQAPKPEPSSSIETKVSNEKAQVSEDLHLPSPKKNYLPVIIIAAILITALVISLYNPGSSSNYEEAAPAEAGTLAIAEVTIGNQVWMAENLNVDKFRNGDPIPEARTDEEWKRAGEKQQPAWCYYNYDFNNGTKYGKLYNWFAVNDPRGLAPNGFHIPSDADWTILNDYLGGEGVAGTKMKSASGWSENGNGMNSSGFSGLPSGHRYYDGTFRDVGGTPDYTYWWSATGYGTTAAWCRYLIYNDGSINRGNPDKEFGLSVRCLRD